MLLNKHFLLRNYTSLNMSNQKNNKTTLSITYPSIIYSNITYAIITYASISNLIVITVV